MKVLVRNHGEGGATVEVIDPSDGACTHTANISDGEQITVTATTAHSPADIEFGECEAIPVAEPNAETEAENERKVAEQPTPPEEEAAKDPRPLGGNVEEPDPEDQAA